MSIYLSSDHHFYHARALEILPNRKFQTIDEMNEKLIQNHNKIVKADDFVIFLGDLVMGNKTINVPKILSQLQGRKALIYGNHDAAFDDNRPGKKEEANKLYLDNGILKLYNGQVNFEQVLSDNNEPIPYDLSFITLCHFPFDGVPEHEINKYNLRYKELHVKDDGSNWVFHGHLHSTKPMARPRMIDVGVDANRMKPVSLNSLMIIVAGYKE